MLEQYVHFFTINYFLLVFVGVFVGIVAGAIPGITGGMTISLVLPLTFYMSSVDSIVLLVAMYVGIVTGGLITATILNIPGTPGALATTFDGHPMAKKGLAGKAIGYGIAASFIGSIVSWIFLILLSPPLANIALSFNHFDYFSMVIMAIFFISSLSEGSLLKAFLAAMLGVLVALPGIDPVSAVLRLEFGVPELAGGFQMLPVLIGIFGVSQVISDLFSLDEAPVRYKYSKSVFPKIAVYKNQFVNLMRSSVIGTWIGLLPGVGGAIASLVAYSIAKNSSSHPEQFGQGSEEGILAAESANNASVGGALIPLITLGIPGSVIDVILIAALIMHGVTPGPLLFQNNPEIAWGIIITMLVASFVMLAIMVVATPWIARMINVPKQYLIPLILVFCVVGAFAVNNRMFDVWIMLLSGVMGYLMLKVKLPIGPFVIGFILAPVAETSLRSGLMASQGDYSPLMQQPASIIFLVLAVFTFFWPFFRANKPKAAEH